MTGLTPRQRRKHFNEEHFDTEDRMDRAIAGVGVVFLLMVLAVIVRYFFF